jgi:hypothetical protein
MIKLIMGLCSPAAIHIKREQIWPGRAAHLR